jgi:16S rRNA (adenine1518-N6/adenine1519-N6)-dimethyltransferase
VDQLTPGVVRSLLDAHGVRPSRALGQNFLTDPNVARRIVRLSGIGADDRVLEIGPGIGSLTLALAETAGRVVALEIDRHLLPVLDEVVGALGNVEVVHGDALEAHYPALLGDERWVLVANLPYNVATPLLARLLTDVPQLARMVVMVQREVAERLAAPPGTRACGAISVKVAYHCTARVLAQVPPSVFTPRPNVDSTVVAFDRRPAPPVALPGTPEAMFTLARAGFGQRRKTLRQSLRAVLGDGAEPVLVAAGIDPTARAETLTLDAWAALTRAAS